MYVCMYVCWCVCMYVCMYVGVYVCTCTRCSFQTLIKLEYSGQIFQNQIPNFTNISPLGAEFFHADGQTDEKKPIVAFRNFANAPKRQELKNTVFNKIRLEGDQ